MGSRTVIGALLGLAWIGAAQPAVSAVLRVDQPGQTSGPNTGSVGATAVSGSSANNLWRDPPFLGRNYFDPVWGSLALSGESGHMFGVVYASGLLDTFTITLNGPIQDPIFYFLDLDGPGATITVPSGGTTFVCQLDCAWSGDTATILLGAPGPQGTSGHAAVQYAGLYGAGSQFSFVFDYRGLSPVGGDIVGIGLGTRLAEPSSGVLGALAAGSLFVASAARRRGRSAL